jgi:hypothetical protein
MLILGGAAPARSSELPTVAELRTALASREPPRLMWHSDADLSLAIMRNGDEFAANGRCRLGRQVVISGAPVRDPVRTDCAAGSYEVELGRAGPGEIVASQVLLDGNILAARHPASPPLRDGSRVQPGNLSAAFASAAPGDRLVLEPGTYDDVTLRLAGAGGTADAPIIIDGRHAVTFTGASKLRIGASHVILRGLTFRDVGASALVISGAAVRLTESEFIGCGDAHRTQAECVIVIHGGTQAEIDFNSFVGSKSMSIKIRAGPDGTGDQPVGASIHHNVFRDIPRLSDNGQEPIQIAGPGGGGSEAMLGTRIEHNLFYRADGDREAVSMKTPGTLLRWNVFRDMDAAPNFRGAHGNTMVENLLIRARPIRVAGRAHRVAGNILLCPRQGIGFVISHGSRGYGAAIDNVLRDNVIAVRKAGVVFAAQTQPIQQMAHGNRIVDNRFHLPAEREAVRLGPDHMVDEIAAANTLSASGRGPALCR